MKGSPTQNEIDALVSQVRGQKEPAGTAKHKSIQHCDFRKAGQLSNEYARAITALHESFARNVSSTLRGYFGISFDVVLCSVEQLNFGEYFGSNVDPGYYLPLSINPTSTDALLQVELPFVYSVIEVLLGGPGKSSATNRDITDIEEDVFQTAMARIVRHLELTWQALDVTIDMAQRLKPAQVSQFLAREEKIVTLIFELRMCDVTHFLTVLVPVSFINILLRRVASDPLKQKSRVRSFPKPSLKERMMDCVFTVEVELPSLRMPVRELVDLRPGNVLKLPMPVKNPSTLSVEGHGLFRTNVVRSGEQKAAQLVESIPHPAEVL